MRTALAYALLLFVVFVAATILGRPLFDLVDRAVHAVYLVLNVN